MHPRCVIPFTDQVVLHIPVGLDITLEHISIDRGDISSGVRAEIKFQPGAVRSRRRYGWVVLAQFEDVPGPIPWWRLVRIWECRSCAIPRHHTAHQKENRKVDLSAHLHPLGPCAQPRQSAKLINLSAFYKL